MKKAGISFAFSVVFSYLCDVFSPFCDAIIVLCVMMIIDYVTGILQAIYKKKLNSKVGAKGILKKALIILVTAMACLLDTKFFGGKMFIGNTVIGFYIFNEGLSILENVGKCGVKYPQTLEVILTQLKKKNDNGNSQEV